jgi:hypothetical protein
VVLPPHYRDTKPIVVIALVPSKKKKPSLALLGFFALVVALDRCFLSDVAFQLGDRPWIVHLTVVANDSRASCVQASIARV